MATHALSDLVTQKAELLLAKQLADTAKLTAARASCNHTRQALQL